ncbi:MAG: PorT family protein [Saprospiraceae bacterium]|nr:PorT family protein [Saprospiraceae bacterium]
MATQINKSLKLLALLLLVLGASSANAQIKYGFKTGLNFAHFTGDSETNDAGADLENWKNATGFHIGMTFGYKFTDQFGVRGEFLYSKRGSKYTFEGQSYRIFKHSNGSVLTLGTSRYLINVNNSYLDIPIMAYGRLGNFEISGGGYVGLLVQSGGEGSLRYSGKTVLGNNAYVNPNLNDTELNFNLNHNYRKDDPGEGSTKSNDEQPVIVKVDAFLAETPKTLGAYYDYPEDKGNLYKSLDFGLVGGIAYYISNALYITGRVQYGLADITNNDADLAKARVGTNGELIFRDVKHQNFMIQASVGFSF